MGRVKGSGEGAGNRRGERRESGVFFSPLHLPPFALAPTLRVTISILPNLPLSSNQRWRLQQYEHEGFADPKYDCTAGYKIQRMIYFSRFTNLQGKPFDKSLRSSLRLLSLALYSVKVNQLTACKNKKLF